ncbi:MAG: 6-phospho-3-hexuloisomerase [Candidatus Thermoplasmatota archaeon]
MDEETIFKKSVNYIHKKLNIILKNIPHSVISEACSLFFEANRVFVYGAGRSGLVAKAFAIRLVHLGFQTFVIGETIGAPVKKGDLVVIVSGSGETIPAVMTSEIAHNIGATVLVITGSSKSRITKYATICICLEPDDNDEKKKLAPLGTLFEASAWVLLDGLIAELMDRKGETERSMQLRHATLE